MESSLSDSGDYREEMDSILHYSLPTQPRVSQVTYSVKEHTESETTSRTI